MGDFIISKKKQKHKYWLKNWVSYDEKQKPSCILAMSHARVEYNGAFVKGCVQKLIEEFNFWYYVLSILRRDTIWKYPAERDARREC